MEVFYPRNRAAWRKWLIKNHRSEESVWLVFHTKKSGRKTITWSDAVDEALCFGWIDSKRVKIDEETSHQFFSKRKPKSTWSRINKEKVQRLIDQQLMTEAGLECIETAKRNGSWTLLDEVEDLVIPPDLENALKGRKGALDYFLGLSKSVKKMMLQWIVLARRPETRQRRINEIAESAGRNTRPKQI